MNNAFTVLALLLWAAAAALLIWLPRIWRRGGAPETNEDWLRLRQRELAGEADVAHGGELDARALRAPLHATKRQVGHRQDTLRSKHTELLRRSQPLALRKVPGRSGRKCQP